jgi:hypothetical protein
MTRAAELRALADRVEAAKGAYRALDGEIWCAINGYEWVMWDGAGAVFRQADSSIGHHYADRIRAFTASLDAAASLVPAGWDWAVTKGFGEDALAAASPANSVATVETQAATPALALTAAALRALAEEAGDE